jgi:putative membrane protein
MSPWQLASVLVGIGAIYVMLQTRFDYLSQHAFFINRVQHVVLHHVGPFLIALGRPGPTIRRGMPASGARAIALPPVVATMRIVQQPVVAFVLFVGLFYIWLIPAVQFRAMLDNRLYALMNWSMVVDGVAFWSLVLDRRPKPPCRVSYPTRAALAFALTFPEIVTGMALTSIPRDIYPYYELCGRVFPSIGPVFSQEIGGIVIWIPPVMMSVVAVFVVLDAMRRHEEKTLSPALTGRQGNPG